LKPVAEFHWVAEDLRIWQAYDPAVKVDCTSAAVRTPEGFVLVDPIAIASATLEEMVGKEMPSADVLTDPLAPEFGGDGYIYFRPAPTDPPDKVVLVSRGQASHGRRAVAFHDGSVRIMPYSLPVDL